jgi:hypothetical protein
MGRKVGEGYRGKQVEYIEPTRTVVILDSHGEAITAYVD